MGIRSEQRFYLTFIRIIKGEIALCKLEYKKWWNFNLSIPKISGVKVEVLQYEIYLFFRPGHYDLCYQKNYDINNFKIQI